ncbi:uncharacterized protein LOC135819838 [Sycon ciliatum]|uniref:uncharacterized protein LOC135819838 n=1 Tax=Sycon ciliatum TaxID=27933 RepID=UPI0031F6367C
MFVYRRHCIGEKRRDQVAARTATRSKRQRTRLAADFYQHVCVPAPLHRREAEGSSCSEDGDEKQTAKNSISCRLLSTCLCTGAIALERSGGIKLQRGRRREANGKELD